MHRWIPLLICILPLVLGAISCTNSGGFTRTIWAPKDQVAGNRFRVNSPDVSTGRFKDRPEAKMTGLMTIPVDDDLKHVTGAGLYLELWGGHPGVENKRFTLNDKTEYPLPEVGAAANHCTYSYPEAPLKLDELFQGENRFQFTCEKGETFWGHYLIRAAAIRLAITTDHPMVAEAGLADFTARVAAAPAAGKESVVLSLDAPAAMAAKIASVEYRGRYEGYDENGNRQSNDWHGYTKDRRPVAIIGTADAAPFAVTWDTSMLPDQEALGIRAVVHFKEEAELSYRTAEVKTSLPARKASVKVYSATKLPAPFWSRADRAKTAEIDLPVDPASIEKAQLHVLIWDGGAGGVENHFTLNGHPLPIAGEGHHDVLYRVVDIDPKLLKRGPNVIVLLSDTVHHGIEVILPGPALVVRTRAE